jgi:hypothetical protein
MQATTSVLQRPVKYLKGKELRFIHTETQDMKIHTLWPPPLTAERFLFLRGGAGGTLIWLTDVNSTVDHTGDSQKLMMKVKTQQKKKTAKKKRPVQRSQKY